MMISLAVTLLVVVPITGGRDGVRLSTTGDGLEAKDGARARVRPVPFDSVVPVDGGETPVGSDGSGPQAIGAKPDDRRLVVSAPDAEEPGRWGEPSAGSEESRPGVAQTGLAEEPSRVEMDHAHGDVDGATDSMDVIAADSTATSIVAFRTVPQTADGAQPVAPSANAVPDTATTTTTGTTLDLTTVGSRPPTPAFPITDPRAATTTRPATQSTIRPTAAIQSTTPSTAQSTVPPTAATQSTTLPTAATSSTVSTPGTMVWEEQFDRLDTSRWRPEHSSYGDGNGERQCYRPENVRVSNGKLVLTARHETYDCPRTGTRTVTSGMVRSRGLTFSPGQAIEFRVKLTPADPDDQAGLWPAVWASSWGGGRWPRGGEMDWLEVMTAENPRRSMHSIHYADPFDDHELQNRGAYLNGNFSDSWHTVRFDYGHGGRLRWYLDGRVVFEVTDADTFQGYPAPFDQTVDEIKINLATGGTPGPLSWGALGATGATFEVDYIRVFDL